MRSGGAGQNRRVRSNSLRGATPILTSNLKKKRDELLINDHIKSRSMSKNDRLVYCDSENVVQIFMPTMKPEGENTIERAAAQTRQREIDNNSSMDVETQMVDKMLNNSKGFLHKKASPIIK